MKSGIGLGNQMSGFGWCELGKVLKWFILCGSTALWLATSGKVSALEYLGEIVVEETQPVVTRIANSFELTRELIEVRGDRSIEQSLEVIPGLNVRYGGQGVPRIDLRGLRTRHVKFMVNGVPFNSTFDGQFDPTFITATQVDRLKVVTSGVSVLYGSGAFGVIDVLTRSQHEPHVKLNAELGGGAQKHLSAQLGNQSENHSYYLNTTHRSRDYFELSNHFDATENENGGKRLNSDRERNTIFGSYTLEVTPDLKIGLNGSFLSGDYGIPPAILKDDFTSKPSFKRIENQQGRALQGSFSYQPNRSYFVRGWLYRNDLEQDENSYDDAHYAEISDERIKGTYLTTTDSRIMGFGVQTGYQFEDAGQLTLGFDAHQDRWNQDGLIRDMPIASAVKGGNSGSGGGSGNGKGSGSGGGAVNNTARYRLRVLNEEGEINTYSLMAEYEKDITDKLSLVAGGGYHRQAPQGLSSASNESDQSYLFGVGYQLNGQLELSASIARKIRMPSIRNLYDAVRGNPQLESEVVEELAGKLNYQLPEYRAELQLALFRNDIRDFIQRNRTTERFENIEKSKIEGIEVSITAQPYEKLNVRFGFSYQRSEDLTRTGRDELTNTPGQIANLDLDYRIGKDFYVHANYRYVGGQYYYSKNEPLQKDRLKDTSRLDLRVSWRPVQSRFSGYVGIKNLLDKDFADEYALPSPGRTFVVGINWQR